jgi:hypothetical protein
MPKTTVPTPLLRKLLEGERTWGGLDVSNGHGIARYRLVVHPPGLSRDERISLRLWRAFPVWGLGLWLLIQAPLMAAGATALAIGAATGISLAVGAVLLLRAGHSRREVRTLTAVRTTERDAEPSVDYIELQAQVERLVHADERLAAGEITAVEHEAETWRVYDRIGTAHTS